MQSMQWFFSFFIYTLKCFNNLPPDGFGLGAGFGAGLGLGAGLDTDTPLKVHI